MVIREIKDNPKEEIKNFDWFNDYKDTRPFVMRFCPEILEEFDAGFQQWLDNRFFGKNNQTKNINFYMFDEYGRVTEDESKASKYNLSVLFKSGDTHHTEFPVNIQREQLIQVFSLFAERLKREES